LSVTPGRWVLASGNRGKLAELTALLADSGIDVVPQSELSIEPVDETACTYLENALIKARHAAEASGLPAIADDSGLSVDALGGAPGVRSARYAGPRATDDDNIDRLLGALADTPEQRRSATFHCVIVGLLDPRDPAPLVAHGRWHGRIALARSGAGGFGYDPVFVDPALGSTAAQLPAADKNRVSHRAQALRQFKELLSAAR
jgi:XTP/dITP diphosphohydrolase